MKKYIIDLGVGLTSKELIHSIATTTGRLLKQGNPGLIRSVLRRFQLIREIMTRGDIIMERVPSEDNITDPHRTKGGKGGGA